MSFLELACHQSRPNTWRMGGSRIFDRLGEGDLVLENLIKNLSLAYGLCPKMLIYHKIRVNCRNVDSDCSTYESYELKYSYILLKNHKTALLKLDFVHVKILDTNLNTKYYHLYID